MSVTPKATWPAVNAMLHLIHDHPDATAVHAQFDRLLDYVQDTLPDTLAHPDAARADILTHADLPKGLVAADIVKQPDERLNREIRSPTGSVKIFPTHDAIDRLV